MELHGGLVFFALLGGLATFGGIGLLVGPLVLTFLVAVLKLYRREFGGPTAPTP
jgi:predicted PurR-regulated permease PerM